METLLALCFGYNADSGDEDRMVRCCFLQGVP